MTTTPGFIEGLSIGLFHDWAPDTKFMILSAYIDESGTHRNSAFTIMAGFYSRTEYWRAFESRWQVFRRKYGFDYLHTIDLFHGQEPFDGLSWEERKEIAEKAYAIAREYAIGFVITLNNNDYAEILRAGDLPKKVSVDSRYGVCIRSILSFLNDSAKKERADRVNIIFEYGHRNMGSATTLLQDFQYFGDTLVSSTLQTVTFANKRDCPEIQIADLMAHSALRAERPHSRASQEPSRYLIEPQMLRGPYVHYWQISREEVAQLKAGLVFMTEIKRRYRKSWRSAILASPLAVEGRIVLSQDPSVVEKWFSGLPERQWYLVPSLSKLKLWRDQNSPRRGNQ